MGEVLFKQYIQLQGFTDQKWLVASAGCWARPDHPATQNAILTAETFGCNLWLHSSQAVVETLLKKFNLVLCMENEHKEFIRRNFPKAATKTYLFSNMIAEEFNIDDPVNGTIETYAGTAQKLRLIMESGFQKIQKLSAGQIVSD
jgi:protein-tyrosine-phosphatase